MTFTSSHMLSAVMRASEFAVIAHDGQRRGGKGLPYVHHCFDVARRIAEAGITASEALVIALLHDVIEDTKFTAADIREYFGEEVARSVLHLTVPPDIGKDFERKVAHQMQMMREMGDWARAVKVADKTSNVADLVIDPPKWSHRAMVGYANDSMRVVDVVRERWCDPKRPEISSPAFRSLVTSFDEAYAMVMVKYK